MSKKQKNFRLPDITLQKIEALKAKTGLTEVQIIIMAIDRFNVECESGLKLAIEALEEIQNHPVTSRSKVLREVDAYIQWMKEVREIAREALSKVNGNPPAAREDE